jgi:hypothetical protein
MDQFIFHKDFELKEILEKQKWIIFMVEIKPDMQMIGTEHQWMNKYGLFDNL